MAQLLVAAAVNIAIGLLVNALFPQKGPSQNYEGPRLGDLNATTSSYGGMIPINYGTVRVSGNLIWAPPIEEVVTRSTQEVGGKGGGGGSATSTTYTYFATFAIAFGEGPADDVLRIWADGKLIYDKTTPTSNLGGLNIRFYPGDETQLPDSIIEAAEGAGNVPAHRGMCYIVFDRLPLANFGNRIPNLTAEISYNATPFTPVTPMANRLGTLSPGSFMVLDPRSDQVFHMTAHIFNRGSAAAMTWQEREDLAIGGLTSVSACYGMNNKCYTSFDGSNTTAFYELDPVTMQPTGLVLGFSGIFGGWGDWGAFGNFSAIGALPTKNGDVFLIQGRSNGASQNGGFVLYWVDPITGRRYQDSTYAFSARIGGTGNGGPIIQDFHNNRIFSVQEGDNSFTIWEISGNIQSLGTFGPADQSLVSAPGINVRLVGTYSKPGDLVSVGQDDNLGRLGGDCYLPLENAVILSDSLSMVKIDLDTGAVLARNPNVGFQGTHLWSTDGKLVYPSIIGVGLTRTFNVLSTEDLSITYSQVVSAVSFPNVDTGWTGSLFDWAYDPRDGGILVGYDSFGTQEYIKIFLDRATGAGVTLSSVVANLCDRAHLLPTEYDVTQLAGETVEGYSVSSQGAVRAAIEPLMRGYLFEGAEIDWKVKFVRRGGASVLTIPEADVGEFKQDDTIGPVKEVIVQEVELPERFTVKYMDRDKDYSYGTQSDKRVALPNPTQSSRSELTLELPLVAKAQPMKRLAQRWLYTSWAERSSIESVIGWKYLALDPTDVFSLSFRGELRRLRMGVVDVGVDLSVSFVSTQEDAASDNSGLSADGGAGYIPQQVPSLYPSGLLALDAPLLRDVEDTAGASTRVYWAAGVYTAGWPGASLLQSLDNGTSYSPLGAANIEATWGTVEGAIANPTSVVTWNHNGTVTLNVTRGIANLVSATEQEVLNGANAIAIIRPNGTCEIIQFQNVTVVSATQVTLSKLLRGRRGTEELATGHSAGETWVLLTAPSIQTFTMPLSLRNVSTEYRLVTAGTLLEDAVKINKTFTGQDLLPYSVCQQKAVINVSNIDLTWKRRTRISGELRDGTGEVPLSEASESYSIDVYSGPGGTITSTVTSATTAVSVPITNVPTTLLAPFNTNANDTSTNAAVGTLGAQAAIQAVVTKFGAGAVEFTPSGSVNPAAAFVSWPDIAAYNVGSNDFTIEAWVRFKSLAVANQTIASQYLNTGNQRGWVFNINGNTLVFFWDTTGAGTATGTATGSFTWAINTWYHVAVTRQGNSLRLFVDGVQVGATATITGSIFNSTEVLRAGKIRSTGFDDFPLNGFIDDFRMVIGRAIYTTNFTPPVAALTTTANPSDVTVAIYQLSAAVGRGRGGPITLTL